MDMGTIPYGRAGYFSLSENLILAQMFFATACGAFYFNKCEHHHPKLEWYT